MPIDGSWALIFGGCCSNVYALEAIVKYEPDSGLLITVTQLAFTALLALPPQLESSTSPSSRSQPQNQNDAKQSPSKSPSRFSSSSVPPLRLRKTQIPLRRLTIMALMFCTVNIMNNWAFAFDISVPMHIVLRSFGSVTTLTVGWLVGKKYSRVQISSVMALTVGVVISAWADASAKGAEMDIAAPKSSSTSSFISGLVVLFFAQLLSAIMGVYTEETYRLHGRHWRENLFYTHALGILFSLILLPSLTSQLRRIFSGPKITLPSVYLDQYSTASSYYSSLHHPSRASRLSIAFNTTLQQLSSITPSFEVSWTDLIPSKPLLYLLMNAFTQYICITGVNRLAAHSTAVTVTVVLNIRKLVSFLLSCWIFGNKLSTMMACGAAVVFLSGGIYGLDSSRGKSARSKVEEQKGVKQGTLVRDEEGTKKQSEERGGKETRDSTSNGSPTATSTSKEEPLPDEEVKRRRYIYPQR